MKDRLKEAIGQTAYILDCLRVLKEIMDSGSCNDCEIRYRCEYSPRVGQQVRYNCPFYERDEEP